MVTLHELERGRALMAVKGRPAEVLQRCVAWFDGRRVTRLSARQRRKLLSSNEALASRVTACWRWRTDIRAIVRLVPPAI